MCVCVRARARARVCVRVLTFKSVKNFPHQPNCEMMDGRREKGEEREFSLLFLGAKSFLHCPKEKGETAKVLNDYDQNPQCWK